MMRQIPLRQLPPRIAITANARPFWHQVAIMKLFDWQWHWGMHLPCYLAWYQSGSRYNGWHCSCSSRRRRQWLHYQTLTLSLSTEHKSTGLNISNTGAPTLRCLIVMSKFKSLFDLNHGWITLWWSDFTAGRFDLGGDLIWIWIEFIMIWFVIWRNHRFQKYWLANIGTRVIGYQTRYI